MDLLLILTYTAICVAVFKAFKIPLNKWTVPTAVLGGIVLIGSLVFLMNYNHPFSEMTRRYFVTVPMVPDVSGRVIEVAAQPNQPLTAGDLIFRIDPQPFQQKVTSLEARVDAALKDLNRARDLVARKLGRQIDLDQAEEDYIDLSAQLDSARFDLANTEYRAPTDGYVTQLVIRPGVRAVSLPLRPVGVFVPAESQYVVGWFRQNSIQRLIEGADAEVLFDGIPGVVFSAVVESVLPAMGQGQTMADGRMLDQSTALVPGRVAVRLRITDSRIDQYQLPGGAYGQSAIYTDHFTHVAVMRKILLRMASWMNYLFPFH
ncbi:HlyD family secretion protein [Motiliproteus sediminis]|uniref:HlyD family secretion protein n=1 Tax=Motiliproteus sediminis TaxID=1468178 RepID=UPI001AEF3A07|nr:HlyD family secretion protein [Motiliproteus sediminis]